ncbi:hypothetical protein BJ170DRAFT_35095 [Xylariales sp. AK1849]|nr:hypothetical protein BJ170DRAFT_35095 [Xylariales sp. AK1849]
MSLAFEQPSPATSTATNRTNRGGRPKEWTDPRTRRLTRLYCYTALKVDQILDVLRDDVWSPGKEAANKHLNHMLGKDPRWMRPRDFGEQRQRIAGLKNSERAKKPSDCLSPSQAAPQPTSAPEEPYYQGFHRADTLDGTSLARSSGSSFEKADVFVARQPYVGIFNSNIGAVVMPQDADLRDLNNPSTISFSRFMPRIRSRQGTSLTTSTDFSVGSSVDAYHSVQQKLKKVNGLSPSDIKDVFRLLKRFTISNDSESGQPTISPNYSAGPQARLPSNEFDRYQQEGIAKYPIPGDIIHTELSSLDSNGRDQFGNTMYHFLAASEGCESELIDFMSKERSDHESSMARANTGGQTFLHVLHDCWFRDGSRLNDLVDELKTTNVNLFYATDVYGRTFFHLLRQKLHPGRIREITPHFNINQLNRRDAFGVRPLVGRATTMTVTREEGPARLTIPTTERGQERIVDNTHLLKVITDTNAAPSRHMVEDNQGRNALHCLSQVVLGMTSIQAHANGTKPVKRKMDENDEPVLQVCPLSQRLQYLETVLLTNVDVNQYNTSGDTVLMSFVSNLIDGQDDKDLELIIKRLIAAGAKLEARNRNGETAIQVAARLGQKFAVKVLLDQGANLHVRNCDGRSVLQSLDDHAQMSGEYPDQLARLEATRGVLTGRFSKFEAVQDPTLLQEWGMRQNIAPVSA